MQSKENCTCNVCQGENTNESVTFILSNMFLPNLKCMSRTHHVKITNAEFTIVTIILRFYMERPEEVRL